MNFRLLGPVEADIGHQPIDLGTRKQRLVLAVLLLEANRLVSLERLIDLVWPAGPPRSARSIVHTLVYRLRGVLTGVAAARWGVSLLTDGPGYRLSVDPMRVDVHRFRDLVRRANTLQDDRRRATVLNEALRLWRGPALADVVDQSSGGELWVTLEEAHLVAQEDRLDAELRMGLHSEVLEEITGLVERHPFRERMVGQLMLSLHRSGRTVQALQVFGRTRERLATELGLDPAPHLCRLYEVILRGEVTQDLGAAAPDGLARRGNDYPSRPVPAQLPAPVAPFVGRAGFLADLDTLLCLGIRNERREMPICVITGTAGVGKTALAVTWAHRRHSRFPDGQIYLDLRGHHTEPPLDTQTALRRCLRALAVPPDHVPENVDEQATLYRSLLAGTQTLVVLDNAANPAQVRPLLPGSASCVIIITSRNQLGGLMARDGAHSIALGPFGPDESYTLLSRLIGPDRVRAEAGPATELATLCAQLPLALRIAATNLVRRTHHGIAEYVEGLRNGDRLDRLSVDGDRQSAVAAAFDLSYQELTPQVRRFFRLLGLLPGPDFTIQQAAALTGVEVSAARPLLDRLASAHLVEIGADDRFGFHELLRLYAANRAAVEERQQDPAGPSCGSGPDSLIDLAPD